MSAELRNGFGGRLEAARVALGLTQAEIAAQMGVSLRSYSRYASDDRAPQINDIVALAGMGVNLNWLLTGSGSMMSGGQPPVAEVEGKSEVVQTTEIDDELMARVVDTIARAYKDAGVALTPMDLGRLAGLHYRRVSRTNVSGTPLHWDETLAMLRFLRISIMDELQKGGAANDSKAQGSAS